MSLGIILGNTQALGVASVALSPSIVGANTTAEQTFTVPGILAADMIVAISKPTAQAGLGIVGWRVSAAGTVGITFSNNTGSGITPTAGQTYLVCYLRPESVQAGVAGV